jgi:hypothetical protein
MLLKMRPRNERKKKESHLFFETGLLMDWIGYTTYYA